MGYLLAVWAWHGEHEPDKMADVSVLTDISHMTCSRDHCGTLNFVECHFITADSLCKRILPSQDPISDSGDIVSARNRVPQRLLTEHQHHPSSIALPFQHLRPAVVNPPAVSAISATQSFPE